MASIRDAHEWHLEMAAGLEFKGKFEEAALHLNRARLLEPALKQMEEPINKMR
jgi:hypothetical protein